MVTSDSDPWRLTAVTRPTSTPEMRTSAPGTSSPVSWNRALTS
jgi:hypothetical protein